MRWKDGYFTLLIVLMGAGLSLSQTSLGLEEAIRLSQEHSFGIEAARYDSLAGHADLRAARAARFPSLNLNAMSSYIDKLQTIDLPIGSIEAGSHDNYQADVRLALPLYTGGRIANQIRAQSALARARGLGLSTERLDNAYQTRRAFLGLLVSRAMTSAAEASLERVRLIGQDVQNLYGSGLADSSDILESELALERARRSFDERAIAARNASLNLARFVGMPPQTEFDLPDSIPNPDMTPYETESPVSRPEIEAQQARADAARHSIGLARAGYLPSLSAYGGYSMGKPNRNFFEDIWNDYWTAGLNLTWDFNLGGQAFSAASSARQTAHAARAAREELEENLALQANVTLENLRLAFRSYEIASREYDIAGRQYHIGLEKQQAGGLTINRLLELEADLTSMEQLFRASLVNFYLSEADYLYAIGSPRIFGGF